MESIFKTKLIEAKEKKTFLKLLFQYPHSHHVVVKRGYVLEIYDDGFSFDERFDGDVAYSFKFLIEVKEEKI